MALHLSPPRMLPLTIVVMLLLLSAKAVTFAKDVGAALGLTSQSTSAASPAAPEPIAGPIPATVIKQPPLPVISDTERRLLEDLRQRRAQLDAREHALDERNNVLEATESRLQSKIDHLAELQSRLDQLDTARKQRQDSNWSGLVRIYESMKPRDAAAIFDVLDMHVMLEVVDRMNERKAGSVLAAMDPERARMVTQMLAQMRLRREMLASSEPAVPGKTAKSAQ
jgi:flagellar motility protein MotE (MotC chaperone)